MPDITMMCCSSNCPQSRACARHSHSGTVPAQQQSFAAFFNAGEFQEGGCRHFVAHPNSETALEPDEIEALRDPNGACGDMLHRLGRAGLVYEEIDARGDYDRAHSIGWIRTPLGDERLKDATDG